jgi:hypothetical protein
LVAALLVPVAFAVALQRGAPRGPESAVHFTAATPDAVAIPEGGLAHNFRLVAHLPLNDDFNYPPFDPLGMPRGSNGDLTATGDCAYVGSIIGYQPPLIIDIARPRRPEVVGPVPDAVPGVGNGMEGIEASFDLLVIDQRNPIGGTSFPPPGGLPTRALSIYDVSNCKRPRLVARYDFEGKNTHTVSLWRDPENPRRVLALQSFSDNPDLQVIDLSGCPRDCNPRLAAAWDMETATGIAQNTHEATMSTDGRRIYMAQYNAGFFMLDSTALLASIRGGPACDPAPPPSPDAPGHCLTLLNPDIEGRFDTDPPFNREWYHTSLKVPGRPYIFQIQEGPPPVYRADTGEILSTCPGAYVRILYAGEDEYTNQSGTAGPTLLRGDLNPVMIGGYATPEQRPENCTREGFKTGPSVPFFSSHDAIVFPNLAIVTYYGAGLRAIDISNPHLPVETGHFFNKPVEPRWCSYVACLPFVIGPDGNPIRRPVAGDPQMFTFSFPFTKDGYLFYIDIHSGLYVLRYRGPHADEIPGDTLCVAGNQRAGYEPCAPYGRTNWGTPGEPEVVPSKSEVTPAPPDEE